jgi:hypothetical protein
MRIVGIFCFAACGRINFGAGSATDDDPHNATVRWQI